MKAYSLLHSSHIFYAGQSKWLVASSVSENLFTIEIGIGPNLRLQPTGGICGKPNNIPEQWFADFDKTRKHGYQRGGGGWFNHVESTENKYVCVCMYRGPTMIWYVMRCG